MSDTERIAEAARRWVALRDRAKKLREKRAGLVCDLESTPFDIENADPRATSVPCWRAYVEESDGAGGSRRERDPERVWCEPCLERDVVNKDYRAATRARGAAERALLALIRNERRFGGGT